MHRQNKKRNIILRRMVSLILATILTVLPLTTHYIEVRAMEENVLGTNTETQMPEETVTPEETQKPDEAEKPSETVTQEETVTPEETGTPEETLELSAMNAPKATWQIFVNGKSTAISGGNFEHAPKLTYAEAAAFSVEGNPGVGNDSIIYLNGNGSVTENPSWLSWDETTPLLPGNYYIGYNFTDNGGTSYEEFSGNFGIRIVAAPLQAPANLAWNNGSTATWEAVTTTQLGNAIEQGGLVGYEATLYKDGSPVKTAEVTNTLSYDFTKEIQNNGYGRYTFEVKAVAGTTEPIRYATSLASTKSSETFAINVTLSSTAGVASVNPADAFLLIAGNATCNSKAISATTNNNFSFEKWSCESEGIAFAPALTSQSATLSVPDDYTGALTVAVIANAKDNKKPEIIEYKVNTLAGGKEAALEAKVRDLETGISAYAFSTETEEGKVAWKPVADTTPAAEVEIRHEIAAAGMYYLYVKDGYGNVSKSNTTYQATKVEYQGYYDNKGSAQALTEYMVADQVLTLSVPSRVGYIFEEWYANSSFTGSPIREISTHSQTPIIVYAKWSRENISFEKELQDLTITYDGKKHTLNANVTNLGGTISYRWYKNDKEIQGATNSTYDVKEVSDSGTYYANVSITLDGETLSLQTRKAEIAIAKKDLTVFAEDKVITYQDDAPIYTVDYSGFAAGEDAGNSGLTKGTITSTYKKGDGVNSYEIIPSGFSASNYTITHGKGTLKVKPIQADTAESGITASLINDTYRYTGSEIKPVVSVKKGESAFDSGNYGVTYEENINVGKGKVIITFSGNYAGVIPLEFTIQKSSFTPQITMEGWTYGDIASVPQLIGNVSPGDVTYYYATVGETETTVKPRNAGQYTVYAKIAATDNYEEAVTNTTSFTIAKREITLTAESATWDYDGNNHSNTNYTMKGSLAGTDSFLSVTVSGQVKNVGTVENQIEYTLSSSTVPENYQITCIPGKLSIKPVQLPIPVNHRWVSANPGRASWVAVTKSDLAVEYRLDLYRINSESTATHVAEAVTKETEHDFAAIIKEDVTANKVVAGYFFTVQAVTASSVNQDNYVESEISGNSTNLYTVLVKASGNEGIQSALVDDKTETVLIQGESVRIVATLNEGYVFPEEPCVIWSTESAFASFGNALKAETTLRISSGLEGPRVIEIKAKAEDEKPKIELYEAQTDEGFATATFHLSATDSKQITGWMITTKAQTPELSDADWNPVSAATITQTLQVNTQGEYYAYLKDNGGNVVRSKMPLAIYEIQFAGDTQAEGVTGTMPRILKVQNKTLTLPENKFVKEGYSFKNWSGTSGIYANQGTYAANTSDTLTAQWSNEQFAFQVEYYYMNTDGTYPEKADSSDTFSATHGSVIRVSDSSIQKLYAGMQLDLSEGKDTSITLNSAGQILKVYYERRGYNITYSYTLPGESAPTTQTVKFLYGTVVSEPAKPSVEGYKFVGWLYGETGKKPDSMPNKNISASGTFSPVEATYTINYYEKNLDGEGYTLNKTLTEEKNASHAEKILFAAKNAKIIEGFTAKGLTVTQGAEGGTTPEKLEQEAEGTVSVLTGKKLYVNYYYERNSYDLVLNVWKESRNSEENRLYQHTWKIPYGTAITPETYETYEKDKWVTDEAQIKGYELADYADWSTGTKPSVMPAGMVTVSRDYVSTTTAVYKVEIYYETEVAGKYESAASLTYYASEGAEVSIGNGPSYTVDFSKFGDSLKSFSYYEFAETHDENVTKGTVTATNAGENPLQLKVYFNRKDGSTKIRYYYNDGTGTEPVLIGTLSKTGKWGTKYDCEPVALFSGSGIPDTWGSSYVSTNKTIDGVSAENYNFKTESYVVSYAGRYQTNGKYTWPGYRFTKAEDLGKVYEIPFGNGVKKSVTEDYTDYINVYYTKTSRDNTYYLNVGYNTKGLKYGVNTFVPMTETIEGVTYKIRIANKIDVFNATFVTDEDTTDYPGSAAYSGTYEYNGVKEGYQEINYKDTIYYTKTEGSEHYLYLVDDRNQFFKGNRTSYNILDTKTVDNKAQVGIAMLKEYLEQYKTEHGDDTNVSTYDDKVKGAIYQNNGFSSIIYDQSSKSSSYVFSFEYADTYTLTYNLGGTTCINHVYTQNETAIPNCPHDVFQSKSGYSIIWYKDGEYKQKASEFKINTNTTLYGRYEKNTLDCHEYVYYELADALTLGGSETSYITAENLAEAKAQLGAELIAVTTDGESIDFEDGAGIITPTKVKIITYTYKNQTVMIDRSYPCLTFKQIEIKDYESYGKEGYHYDNTNSNNRLMGYCQAEAVPLSVYFARDQYAVTVMPLNSKVSNSETKEYRFRQTVALEPPEKNGYEFAGWSWEKGIGTNADGSELWEAWTEAPTTPSFSMPALRLRAKAQWKPTTFEQTIMHYFQDETQTYQTKLLKTLQGMTGTSISVSFEGGTDPQGKAYYNSNRLEGISMTLVDGKVAWFSEAVIGENGVAVVEASDLIAIEEKINVQSESTQTVSTYVIPNTRFSMFSYFFTIYQEDIEVKTLQKDESFTNTYGMQVDYYYTRATNFRVYTIAKAVDGGEPGSAMAGFSTHYYGQAISLRANLAEGYEFIGWYEASKVLEGYTEESDLTTLSLKNDISEITPVSTEMIYTLRVVENRKLVAVTKAKPVSLPTVSITGKQEYRYNYEASSENVVRANVTLAGEGAQATQITGYQWYEDNVEIAGATSSTYLFPTGKEAGTYPYHCKVTVGRKDNGRTGSVTSAEYQVTVSKAPMVVTATGYSATYDGKAHGITVQVKTPENADSYEIYYSQEPLNESNFKEKGKTDPLLYTDVSVDDKGSTQKRTIYFYVHNEAGNYEGFAGSETVTIYPITLTVKAGLPYSKTYDSKAEVEGSVITSGTGKYELAHNGHYTVSGLLSADQGETYILDFHADFNSKHAKEASYITLSNMVVVHSDSAERNYNYAFASGTTLIISGYIKPFALDIDWAASSSVIYDGKEHAPKATLKAGQTPPDNIAITVLGGQTNVGTYTAYAAVQESSEYDYRDYSFLAGDCAFSISKREISITPKAKTTEYNAQMQRITEFSVDNMVEGQTYLAGTDSAWRNKGNYTVTATNMAIQSEGKNVTDNYLITYQSEQLVITPKPVTISGITAKNKTYDGTTDAIVELKDVIFDGLIGQESLGLDSTKIKGFFESKDVGQAKKVALQVEDGLFTGNELGNYELDWTKSQQSTTATISQAVIIVKKKNATTVYGEAAPFQVTYEGFSGSDTQAVMKGQPIYTIKASSESEYRPYTQTDTVGDYAIQIDISGLQADDYRFETVAGEQAILTVTKRPVNIVPVETMLSKEYDGTKAAKNLVTNASYRLEAISGDTSSGAVNGDVLSLASFAADYNSKDVADANEITVTNLVLNNHNYELQKDSFALPAKIEAKSLTVTVEDKEITYADAAPDYTVSYQTENFVEGENKNNLTGTLIFSCDYDVTNEANRNVRDYPITASGYENGNYTIQYVAGTLSVEKAVIQVIANSTETTYKKGIFPTAYSGTLSGFQYGDTETMVSNRDKITYRCDANAESAAGTYDIVPQLPEGADALTADNYRFEAKNGVLTVKKNEIKITGIAFAKKIYDATTAITKEQIISDAVQYGGIEASDVSKQGFVFKTGAYKSADVGTDIPVTFSVQLNEYLDARYLLHPDTQNTATADIEQKALTVTAENKSIVYGSDIPTYLVRYEGFAGTENSTSLSGALEFTCSYAKGSNVNDYTITPKGYTSNNYTITYATGTLTVTQAKLAAPLPVWSITAPGTITWKAVASIDKVNAAGYRVELYKNGITTPVHTQEVATGSTSYNLLEIIRQNGEGYYVANITAKASEESGMNDGKKNVADSTKGSSAKIYAAKVSVGFADDAISQSGKDTATINGASEYIMVAGENNIPITVTLQNETGYTVGTGSASNKALTLGIGQQSGKTYTTTAALGTTLNSAANIVLTMPLKATPATLNLEVTADTAEATYGYTVDKAPKITVSKKVGESDNVTVSDYTYTYQWKLKKGSMATPTEIAGETNETLSFPLGSVAATNYYVICDVIATRKDNKQEAKVSSTPFNIIIKKAEFTSEAVLDGWTYGDKRKEPGVTSNPENVSVLYEYSTGNGNDAIWTNSIPKDAGTYYVRATIAASTNYDKLTTNPKQFVIVQETLAAPTNIHMEASATAPYGKAVWDAVSGLKENAGTEGDTDSSVSVSYLVKLYCKERNETETKLVNTYTTQNCEYDMTKDIGKTGTYTFTVTAVAKSSNEKINCLDSPESTYSSELSVGGRIEADGDVYRKMYDAAAIHLKLIYQNEGAGSVTYQWYRNGTAIEGATDATYDVIYVEQNGVYSCNITVGGEEYNSTHKVVEITPRSIRIASDSEEKVYDGTVLQNANWKVEGDVSEVAGEIVSATVNASIADVGEKTNTITEVKIVTPGNKTVYQEGGSNNNYVVTVNPGILKVTPKALNGITITEPVTKTYDGTAHTQTITVMDEEITEVGKQLVEDTDYTISYVNNVEAGTAQIQFEGKGNYKGTVSQSFTINKRPITVKSSSLKQDYNGNPFMASGIENLSITEGTLAQTQTLFGVQFIGTQTNAGTSSNTFEQVVIHNAANEDVTKNYEITPQYGKLTVNPISDTITITQDPGKKYDGNKVSDPTYTRNGTGSITYQYYTKQNGSYTLRAEAPKDAGTYAVKMVEEANGNYLASESAYQDFTISKRTITITADDKSSRYGEALEQLTYTIGGDGIVQREDLSIILSTTAKENSKAGEYAITVDSYDTANQNYSVTSTAGKYYITKNAMTVIAKGYVGNYDGEKHHITVTVDTLSDAVVYYAEVELTKDNYQIVGKTENPQYQDAGTYTVYYYVHSNNYDASIGSKDVVIRQAEQVISATNEKLLYDGNAHSIQAIGSGDGTLTYLYTDTATNLASQNAPMRAGNYKVVITAGNTRNYKEAKATVMLEIEKRPLTIKAADAFKVYDKNALTNNSYTIESGTLASTDKIDSIAISGTQTDAGKSVNTIIDTIIKEDVGGEERTENYAIIYQVGVLEVEKAPQNKPDNLTVTNESIETMGDGKIAGIKEGMEYRKKGERNYILATQAMIEKGEMEELPSAIYELRYAESKNYYASEVVELEVSYEDEAILELALQTPKFGALTEGYTQSDEKELVITSSEQSNVNAKIIAVTSSNPAFTIIGEAKFVKPGESITQYRVRANMGLKAGNYVSTITVTYGKGDQLTETIFLEVKPKEAGNSGNASDRTEQTPTVEGKKDRKPEVNSKEEQLLQSEEELNKKQEADEIQSDADSKQDEETQTEISRQTEQATAVSLEDKKIAKEENFVYGAGKVRVVIHSSEAEEKRIEAAIVSSKQVIDAALSEEEKAAIASGEEMEIRLRIELLKAEVPKEDATLIHKQIQDLKRERKGITLGEYVGISLDKRWNQGDWESIPETRQDIGIEIEIPKWLIFEDTDYFVSRAHSGKAALLEDEDDKPEIITISSRYFSTYAILYTLEGEEKTCNWHIFILVALAIYILLALTWKKDRRKRYILLLAGDTIIFVVLALAGTCSLDWPMAIGSTVIAITAVPVKKLIGKKETKE